MPLVTCRGIAMSGFNANAASIIQLGGVVRPAYGLLCRIKSLSEHYRRMVLKSPPAFGFHR
jgi:hypothetical protein